MRYPSTKNLFCSTFGHNYFRVEENNSDSSELVCKTCRNHFYYDDTKDTIVKATIEENETNLSIEL